MAKKAVEANLRGKVALVTGGNGGIGKEIAIALARLGADVVIGVRNKGKGELARQDIGAASNSSRVFVEELDVSNPASIRGFAARFAPAHPALHILVNNAGGWSTDYRSNVDGHELQWATHVLGPFLLTRLLEPQLRAASGARVVNVSTVAAGRLDLKDVDWKQRKYSGFTAYMASKQALRMLTWSFATAWTSSKITATAVNPGFVRTDLNRDVGGIFRLMPVMGRFFGKTPAQGADVAVWAAASSELEGITNKFYSDRKEVECKFRDPAQLQALWKMCEQMTAPVARGAGAAA